MATMVWVRWLAGEYYIIEIRSNFSKSFLHKLNTILMGYFLKKTYTHIHTSNLFAFSVRLHIQKLLHGFGYQKSKKCRRRMGLRK